MSIENSGDQKQSKNNLRESKLKEKKRPKVYVLEYFLIIFFKYNVRYKRKTKRSYDFSIWKENLIKTWLPNISSILLMIIMILVVRLCTNERGEMSYRRWDLDIRRLYLLSNDRFVLIARLRSVLRPDKCGGGRFVYAVGTLFVL